jgi:hypothetical protein
VSEPFLEALSNIATRVRSTASLRRRLQECSEEGCGQTRCVEVCAFADWRRRLQLIPAACRLFEQAPTSVYEVKVVRGAWDRRAGDLQIDIRNIKRMSERALKRLEIPNHPNVVAAGTIKPLIGTSYEPHWVVQLHLIVAGADWDGLIRVFDSNQKTMFGNSPWAERVKNLAQTINSVFCGDVRGWPRCPDEIPFTPTAAHRQEFFQWLLGLRFGERIIRYGCDEHLNGTFRIIPPKPLVRYTPKWSTTLD